MENSDVSKFSAYTQICEIFIKACQDHEVNPIDCLQTICRFFNVSAASPPVQGSASSKERNIVLTKEQVDTAKREAKKLKASKLKVSPNEVNLTPKEIEEAKREYRDKLLKGSIPSKSEPAGSESLSPNPPGRRTGDGKEEVNSSSKPHPTAEKKESVDSKIPKGKGESKTGSRSTAKTRIDSLRALALKARPLAQNNPKLLHLVAYSNHHNRLRRQWGTFQNEYNSSGLLDPLRELPDPWLSSASRTLLQKITEGLREQDASPNTFVLQTETGGSFWDKDMPSEACPSVLKDPVPDEILAEYC